MIRSYVLAATAAFAAFASVNALAAEALPSETHKLLPAALAVEAAQTAISTCKGQGYNVAVTITDRVGTPALLIVGDGSGALSREISRRKAYTSAQLKSLDRRFRQKGRRRRLQSFDLRSPACDGGGRPADQGWQ